MLHHWKFYLLLALVLCLSTFDVQAQNPERVKSHAPSVTATATTEQVRFTALGEAAQVRLEVFSLSGEKLFDSEARAATFLDWKLQNQQGDRLPDGTYRCLLTVKTVAGIATQVQGLISVQAGQASVPAPGADQQSLTPVDRRELLESVPAGSALAVALLAHDGTDGQLVSGSGALSFRTGDFFAGQDQEQMRLTPEGKLGIGIKLPQAKLDVAGTIRTSEGIIFPDGSIQTTAAGAFATKRRKGQDPKTDEEGKPLDLKRTPTYSISGTGTTNRITKWTDGPNGVVGDSTLTEVGGNIGIGTTSPITGLDYRHTLAPFLTRDIGTTNFGSPQSAIQIGVTNTGSRNVNVGPSFLFFADDTAGQKEFLGRLSAAWENPTDGAEAGSIRFNVRANSADTGALTERMRITAAGNVGVGTTTPAARMHALSNDTAVFGETISTLDSAAGIFGRINSTAPGAFSAGVRGVNNGTGTLGIGVYGSQAGSGWGIYGEAPSGRGVYGLSTTGIGVYGKSTGGNGIYAESQGGARNAAALRVNNGNTTNGMAAYMTNNSDFATAHFANNGPGEVLYLQALVDNQAGGGQCVACTRAFIKAVNWQENDTKFMVNQFGHVYSDSGFSTPAADFAEMLPAEEGLEAGDVLVIAEDGKLARSTRPYQASVAGVYSTKPGFIGGRPINGDMVGHIPLAVVGIVPVKVTAENGPIRPGDLLTASSTPGHAMKAGANPVAGTLIGKALGKLKDGSGVIQMLAVLQ